MISQFGVKGFNLVNGAFEFYEITVNGEYKGTVNKPKGMHTWGYFTGSAGCYGYQNEKEAIDAIKQHLREGGK